MQSSMGSKKALAITCILQVMLIGCRMCLGSLNQNPGPAARKSKLNLVDS